MHRLILAAYILWNYRTIKMLSSKTGIKPAAEIVFVKKPKHVLLSVNSSSLDSTADLKECVTFLHEQNVEYLTILGANGFLLQSLMEMDEIHVYNNHKLLKTGGSGLSVNFITANQQEYYVSQLKDLAKDPEFKLDATNWLSSMTPFSPIDFILCMQPQLTFAGCLPSQIGFAETM